MLCISETHRVASLLLSMILLCVRKDPTVPLYLEEITFIPHTPAVETIETSGESRVLL